MLVLMRRLVVEFPKDEFDKIEGDSPLLQNVKTLQVLMFLRHNDEEITMICRVELETEVSNIEDYARLVSDGTYRVQVLERENSGAYIVLVKHKIIQADENLRRRSHAFWEEGGYVVSREIWAGKFRTTFLGNMHQIRQTLKILERSNIRHRIVSSTDEKFSPDSPLNTLTQKQRRVLIAAYKLGYYDTPRKISSRQLSQKLGLHKSALATHRRKAEHRLLAAVLSESKSARA
jgi:predicted DNA binding protein